MKIKQLPSGGVIACYKCKAACAHCLYGCSYNAGEGYINEETASNICQNVRRLGCHSLHIGGGEPFLDVAGLITLIKTMKRNGLSVDYIETNAGWITRDMKANADILNEIINAGGNCIMVSTDFFHIEFIPFWKVKALIELFEQAGIDHFIWQHKFLHELNKLDPEKTYTRQELEATLGYDAVLSCAREYGMGFNGRALNLLRLMGVKKPAAEFLNSNPCDNLLRGNHFHADLYGRYVPPGCTGIGIAIKDIPQELDAENYPAVSRLFGGGLKSLYELAVKSSFEPDKGGYVSKCELCFSIRKYLVINFNTQFPDLVPEWFYMQDF